MGVDVALIQGQHPLGTCLRILEAARSKVCFASLELDFLVIGKQVCRTNDLAKRARRVTRPDEHVCELVTRVTVPRVLLDGVSELERRFGELFFRHVAFAALEILELLAFRVLATRRDTNRENAET